MKGGKKLLNNRRSGQTIKHENRESAGLAIHGNANRSKPTAHISVERVCSCRNGVVERTRFAPLRTGRFCNACRDELWRVLFSLHQYTFWGTRKNNNNLDIEY